MLLSRIMSSFAAYIGNSKVYFDRRSLYPCLSLSIVRLEDILECLPPRKHEKKASIIITTNVVSRNTSPAGAHLVVPVRSRTDGIHV